MHYLAGNPGLRLIEDAHDGYLIARLGQMREQRRSKCCKPALRGRIGAAHRSLA
jgi:hypothetical protein